MNFWITETARLFFALTIGVGLPAAAYGWLA